VRRGEKYGAVSFDGSILGEIRGRVAALSSVKFAENAVIWGII